MAEQRISSFSETLFMLWTKRLFLRIQADIDGLSIVFPVEKYRMLFL